MIKEGLPKRWELVLCKITRINPHSALADLIEYRSQGLIQASEVAKKWVRNITEFVKEGQIVVCLVMNTYGTTIDLSLKRVRPEDASRKLTAYKKEKRVEKLLEIGAKEFKKTIEEAYKEVGYNIQEEFGSLVKGFEIAGKNPELFRSKLGKNKWTDKVIEIAYKSFEDREYNIRSNLNLVSYSSDGISVIKSVLKKAKDKGFEIKYISTPNYLLIGSGKDFKKVRQDVEQISEEIISEVKMQKGEASFEIEGK